MRWHLLSPGQFRTLNLEDEVCLVMLTLRIKVFYVYSIPQPQKSIFFPTAQSRSIELILERIKQLQI